MINKILNKVGSINYVTRDINNYNKVSDKDDRK